VPVFNAVAVMRTNLETADSGAAGGSITIEERSGLGTCAITVATATGQSAGQIATAIETAFQAPGVPGPNPRCPSRLNPRDVVRSGDSLITVLASDLTICLRDAGVGFTLTPEELSLVPTSVTYTGATTGEFHDRVTPSAILTLNGGTSMLVPNQTITFTLGTQSCTGVTNAAGAASCSLTLNQVPGPYTVTASFAGAGLYLASNTSKGFTITREETSLVFTEVDDEHDEHEDHVEVKAKLTSDRTPLHGETVTFMLGSGALTCSAVTDREGIATCKLRLKRLAGPVTLTATFRGNRFYAPSSATRTFTKKHDEENR
jgi:hypothetical protein